MIVSAAQAAKRLGMEWRELARKAEEGEILCHYRAGRKGKRLVPYWYEPEVQGMEEGRMPTADEIKRHAARWPVTDVSNLVIRTSLEWWKVLKILRQCQIPYYRIGKKTSLILEGGIDMKIFDAPVKGTRGRKNNNPFGSKPEDQFITKTKDGRYVVTYRTIVGRKRTMTFPNVDRDVVDGEESRYLATARYWSRNKTGVGKPLWKTTNGRTFKRSGDEAK